MQESYWGHLQKTWYENLQIAETIDKEKMIIFHKSWPNKTWKFSFKSAAEPLAKMLQRDNIKDDSV